MTESLSYLAAAWALYAIALALERPTVLRQLAVLAAVAAAFLTRPQFGILYVTWVGALALLWLVAPATRPRTRRDLVGSGRRRCRSCSALLAFVARLALGRVGQGLARRVLGALARLRPAPGRQVVRLPPRRLRRLPRGRAGRGRARSCSGSSPAPGVRGRVGRALRRAVRLGQRHAGCSSSRRSRARRGATTASTTATASTSSRSGSSASSSGSPPGLPRRPVAAVPIGAVAALALPLILPFGQLANEAGIDTVPGALWERIEAELAGPGPASGAPRARRRSSSALLAATFLLPRRIARIALPARRGDLVRRHVVLRVGADDRRPGGPRLRGRARARLDRRAASGRRARDEALRRHELRLRARAARALPHGVLQLDRRPRRLHRRLRPGRAARSSASTSPRRARSSARAGRSSRTTSSRSPGSSSTADASPRAPPPGSCSGEVDGPVRVVGASSNAALATRALRLAHAAQVAARVERDEELLARCGRSRTRRCRRGTSRSPRAARGAGPCGSARCSSPRRSGSRRPGRGPRTRRARPRRATASGPSRGSRASASPRRGPARRRRRRGRSTSARRGT